ncbi:MAG TPA: hypothetical protein VI387_04860 [Candidatus Brocadiales bacterium]|nr:hypothetical protein [Candidatus Brocadiales bacterium]
MIQKIVRISLLAILAALVIGVGAYKSAEAATPWCNITSQTTTLFSGNTFKVNWKGSPNVASAYVVWPQDSRGHWFSYSLDLSDDSFGPTKTHSGSAQVDLTVGNWSHGELIVVLTSKSAQTGHSPAQNPPICKAHLWIMDVVATP